LSSDNGLVASPPASTKTSLGQKLRDRARQRWPQLAGIGVRFRGQFAYVTGKLPDGSELPLCRLRYVGYATTWGFAIYRASHDDYQDNFLPSGQPSGTPEEALDCACGLYLGDPTAWLTPPGTDTPTDLQAGALARRRRLQAASSWAAAIRCCPVEAGSQDLADQVRVTPDDPHVPSRRNVRPRVVRRNHADQAARLVGQRCRLHRADT